MMHTSTKSPAWFYGLFFGLMTVVIIATALAPRLLAFAPAAIGLIFFVAYYFVFKAKPLFPRKSAFIWAFLIPGMAIVSALWAIESDIAMERGTKLATVLLPGIFLVALALQMPNQICRKYAAWFPAAVCIVGTFISFELLFDLPVFRAIKGYGADVKLMDYLLNRGTAVYCLLALPCLLLISSLTNKNLKIALYLVMALSMGVIMTLTFSQSSQLAIIGTVLFFGLVSFLPPERKYAWWCLSAVITALILSAPFVVMGVYDFMLGVAETSTWLSKGAGSERLEIWDFVSRKIMENPLYGFGAEATRSIIFDTQQLHYPSDTVLHPHNFALQLWIEYGVIGAAMGSAFCVYMIETIRRSFTAQQARYVLPVFIAALSLAATGYGIWQGWLLGLFMLTMAVVVIAVRASSTED